MVFMILIKSFFFKKREGVVEILPLLNLKDLFCIPNTYDNSCATKKKKTDSYAEYSCFVFMLQLTSHLLI
jgi:hypothetical protein